MRAAIEDHPRIRGKDFKALPPDTRMLGSPPHTRERLPVQGLSSFSSRITPAYAGKTLSSTVLMRVSWDHPRIRGKDAGTLKMTSTVPGSPPHTRERPGMDGVIDLTYGITPAYAGKTASRSSRVRGV